mmetsp:Transcript_127556/g.330646  ORF Transcript_127556/g.330646 Transcript_127556/m.330646 type:complete len:227 (-) Transcript_127556:254-934(-)
MESVWPSKTSAIRLNTRIMTFFEGSSAYFPFKHSSKFERERPIQVCSRATSRTFAECNSSSNLRTSAKRLLMSRFRMCTRKLGIELHDLRKSTMATDKSNFCCSSLSEPCVLRWAFLHNTSYTSAIAICAYVLRNSIPVLSWSRTNRPNCCTNNARTSSARPSPIFRVSEIVLIIMPISSGSIWSTVVLKMHSITFSLRLSFGTKSNLNNICSRFDLLMASLTCSR